MLLPFEAASGVVTATSLAAVTDELPRDVTVPFDTACARVVAELLGIVAVTTTLPAATVSVISFAGHPVVLAIDDLMPSNTTAV